MKHTPGPWRYNDDKRAGYWPYVQRKDAGGFTVQSAHGQDNATADARLIAAAPELLAALENALDLIEYNDIAAAETILNIKNAIAKAIGET